MSSVLSALCACAPDMITPQADSPIAPHYDTAQEQNAAAMRADWEMFFNNAELSALVQAVRLHNYDLAAAFARIEQASALADAARVPLMPSINSAASASHTRTPGTQRASSGPFTSTQTNQFSLGLSASYVLDIWGRYRSAYEAQKQALEATRFDRDALDITLSSLTASTYMNLLAAHERLAVGQNNIKLANRILAAIKARLDVGTASALDLAQQEGIVASQKAALPPLELQIQQSQNQLAVLAGRPPEGFHLTGRQLSNLTVPRIAAGLPSELLTQRPDIASAEANLHAAQADIAAARRAFFPSLTLTATGGLESIALKNLSFPQAEFSTLAAGLTQPIFDGGTLNAQLALSQSRHDELLANYQKTIINAFSDVESALAAVIQTEAQLKLQRNVLNSARRAYAITEERLRAGTIDIVTLLNVQQTMFQAQDALIQTKLARLHASLSLIQTLGGGMALHNPNVMSAAHQAGEDAQHD